MSRITLVSLGVFFMLLALVFQSNLVKGEYDVVGQEVVLDSPSSIIDANSINLANITDSVEHSSPKRLYEDISPRVGGGTYYGPYSEVSEYSYSYTNLAIASHETYDYIIDNDLYYYVVVGLRIYINQSVIMNGASKFWIDLPMRPDPVLLKEVNGYYTWGESYIVIESPRTTGDYEIGGSSVYGIYENGHFYSQINMPLFPSIDLGENNSYPIKMTFYLSFFDSNPSFYLSGSVLGRPNEDLDYWHLSESEKDSYRVFGGDVPDNNNNRIWYDHFWIADSNTLRLPYQSYIEISGTPGTTFGVRDTYYDALYEGGGTRFTYLPWDVSFGYGLLFEQGIGEGNVWGSEYSLDVGDKLMFYTLLNATSVSSHSYLSYYIPYISEEPMELAQINITLIPFYGSTTNLSFIDEGIDPNTTRLYKHLFPFANNAITMNWTTDVYHDFLLFSSTNRVNISTIGGYGYVWVFTTIEVNRSWNGTLLFHLLEEGRVIYPASFQYACLPSYLTFYKRVGSEYVVGSHMGGNQTLKFGLDLTEGVWIQNSSLGPGIGYRYNYFPIEVYTGTNIYYVSTKINATEEEVVVKTHFTRSIEHFNKMGVDDWEVGSNLKHLALGIYHGIAGIVEKIWGGLQTVYGWIQTGLSKLFTTIQAGLLWIGSLVVGWIEKFVDLLTNVIEWMKERFIPILQVFFLLLVCSFALIVIGSGSKTFTFISRKAEGAI